MRMEDVQGVEESGFYTAPGYVATEPFASRTPEVSGGGRVAPNRAARQGLDHVAFAEYNRAIVGLRVVFPSTNGLFRPGFVIWVEERNKASDWGKSVMTYHDTQFILVPDAEVRAMEYPPETPDAKPA